MHGFWTWNHENRKNLRIALTQPYQLDLCFFGPGKILTGAPCFWPQRNEKPPGNSAIVTFLGWLSDHLKGESWPPTGESKGHGLNHLACFFFSHVFKKYPSSWLMAQFFFFGSLGLNLRSWRMIPSVPEMVNFLRGARKASRIVGGDVKDDVTEVSENLNLFPFP